MNISTPEHRIKQEIEENLKIMRNPHLSNERFLYLSERNMLLMRELNQVVLDNKTNNKNN